MAWRAVARYSIGTNNQKRQMPCQDYGRYLILNDTIVGAVADGAGSAKHSDIGAKLVVHTTIKYLSSMGKYLKRRKCCYRLLSPVSSEQAKKLFTKMLKKKVLVALHKQALGSGYVLDDLACTLLAFVATPHWIIAMQIGDGFMVVRPQKEKHQLLFQPDKGEFINETSFVTSANALSHMRVRVLKGKQEFICTSTDGLENVGIDMKDWTPFPPFFDPLEEYLWETSNPEEQDEYITSFLDSDRLNARTSDDKTLLLCLFDRIG